MRCRLLGLCLTGLGLLVATPVRAAVCDGLTLVGTYSLSLAGADTQGIPVSNFGFVSTTEAASNEDGSFSGTFTGLLLSNQQGAAVVPTQVTIAGSYQLFDNCIVNFLLLDQDSLAQLALLTGYTGDGGNSVLFGSIFDPATQLSGLAQRTQ